MTSSLPRSRATNDQLFAPLLWLLVGAATILPFVLSWSHGAVDFSLFLESTRLWLRHQDPYVAQFGAASGINLNPPAAIVALTPIALMPSRLALGVWCALELGGLAWSVRCSWQQARLPPLLVTALSVSVLSGGIAVQLGQLTFVLLPLTTWAWLAHRERRSLTCGFCVGLLIYLKPFFGLFLVYWLCRRDWKTLGAATATSGLLWLTTLLFLFPLSVKWLAVMGMVDWQGHVLNASSAGLTARLLSERLPHAAPTFTSLMNSPTGERLATVVLDLAILVATWFALRRSRHLDRQWTLVGCAALLISPLGWTYYFPLLAAPLAASLTRRQLVVPLILLNIPGGWIDHSKYGVLGTAFAGSLSFWVLLYMWGQLLRSEPPARAAHRAVTASWSSTATSP